MHLQLYSTLSPICGTPYVTLRYSHIDFSAQTLGRGIRIFSSVIRQWFAFSKGIFHNLTVICCLPGMRTYLLGAKPTFECSISTDYAQLFSNNTTNMAPLYSSLMYKLYVTSTVQALVQGLLRGLCDQVEE